MNTTAFYLEGNRNLVEVMRIDSLYDIVLELDDIITVNGVEYLVKRSERNEVGRYSYYLALKNCVNGECMLDNFISDEYKEAVK